MQMHEIYMRRCIELATSGIGNVAPNPMVGAVIVHNGKIIGEGFHQLYGKAHAEPNAINSVADKSLLSSSTMYVSLEPCAHYGKTPPCADLIIKSGIPEVVIGTIDPFAKVAGKGIEMLKDAGIKVTVGVLEQECQHLNRRFFTYHQKKRPFIILKWAETLDGFIDIDRSKEIIGRPTWISSPAMRVLVHKWRSEEQAILVGTNTVLKDNPCLNIRDWKGNNPLRVVIDRRLSLPSTLNVFDGSQPTLVFTEKTRESFDNLEYCKINFTENAIEQMLNELYNRGILSVIIEGGAYTLQNFIDKGLWDEARVFTGNTSFIDGIKAPEITSNKKEEIIFGNEKLTIYQNQKQ